MKELINPPAIVRMVEEDLSALAKRINANHKAGETATRKKLEHYRAAGEDLIAAKAKCGHGKFRKWLQTNVKFSKTQAHRYMTWAKCPVTGHLEDDEPAWRRISGNAPTTDDDTEEQDEEVADSSADDEPQDSEEQTTKTSLEEEADSPGGAEATEEEDDAPEDEADEEPPTDQAGETEAPQSPAPSKTALDAWGIPIQPHAAEAFALTGKFKAIVKKLKEAAGELSDLVEGPAGKHIIKQMQFVRTNSKTGDGKWILSYLENAIKTVDAAMPRITDCPNAYNEYQSHPPLDSTEPGECQLCRNARWIGSPKGHQIPPILTKAMKEHYGIVEEGADLTVNRR